AGLSGTDVITISADSTAPSGQSVDLPGGPYYTTLSVPVSLANGSDSGPGIDAASGIVERAEATLSNGTCGSFGSYAPVSLAGGADAGVLSGNCYRYRYLISDKVGNQSSASAASADAKVDATAPSASVSAPTAVTGAANQSYNSSAGQLWFRPSGSGSFTLNATASDGESGIDRVAFPDLSSSSGWSGSGGSSSSSPYSSPADYSWTSGAAAPGSVSI